MEQLYIFGTGHAAVTRNYNTCFAIRDGEDFFMTDAGGGNRILGILQDMEVPLERIHHIFVTHEHTDHILGIVWMVRMIGSRILAGKYQGNLHLYCHQELTDTIYTLCRLTVMGSVIKLFGSRIHLTAVSSGETLEILGHSVTFFDIHSTKAKQFGYRFTLKDGRCLTCAGDEPYNPLCRPYVMGSSWLLHEAFCLYGERERYKPYEKHHSTVKDACELAQSLGIPNLVLWHTEEDHGAQRQKLYMEEGAAYYTGRLYVPEDGTVLDL
ncbi:MAG: MBL fold metallo-hydrolase [Lachnospiraceae bacterium]|jgi:ribonuclease Z|nr:MBL fold metallo-hydrolase [Lachnospiraceae bacterium]